MKPLFEKCSHCTAVRDAHAAYIQQLHCYHRDRKTFPAEPTCAMCVDGWMLTNEGKQLAFLVGKFLGIDQAVIDKLREVPPL